MADPKPDTDVIARLWLRIQAVEPIPPWTYLAEKTVQRLRAIEAGLERLAEMTSARIDSR